MTEHGCKVCRIIDERGLGEYESRMVAYWKGERKPRKGYRQLADWLNVTVLRRELDRAGLPTLGNEAESKYERLQTGEVVADEIRMALRTAGVPVDRIESDFVSYGVVRTHLTDCLGEEYEADSTDWEGEAIRRATEHAETKITEAVRAAVSKGKLEAVGDVSVAVSVDVECQQTHARVPVERAFRRGYVSAHTDGTERAGDDRAGSTEKQAETDNDVVTVVTGDDGDNASEGENQ